MAVLTNSTVLLRVRHTYGKFKCIKLSLAFKSLKCLSLISSFFFGSLGASDFIHTAPKRPGVLRGQLKKGRKERHIWNICLVVLSFKSRCRNSNLCKCNYVCITYLWFIVYVCLQVNKDPDTHIIYIYIYIYISLC